MLFPRQLDPNGQKGKLLTEKRKFNNIKYKCILRLCWKKLKTYWTSFKAWN